METVEQVEGYIYGFEGFRVRILHPDGRDVCRDYSGLPSYRPKRPMKGSETVKTWRDKRFLVRYGEFNFDVEVLRWGGKKANGNTLLDTVRDSYRGRDPFLEE